MIKKLTLSIIVLTLTALTIKAQPSTNILYSTGVTNPNKIQDACDHGFYEIGTILYSKAYGTNPATRWYFTNGTSATITVTFTNLPSDLTIVKANGFRGDGYCSRGNTLTFTPISDRYRFTVNSSNAVPVITYPMIAIGVSTNVGN